MLHIIVEIAEARLGLWFVYFEGCFLTLLCLFELVAIRATVNLVVAHVYAHVVISLCWEVSML